MKFDMGVGECVVKLFENKLVFDMLIVGGGLVGVVVVIYFVCKGIVMGVVVECFGG